MTKKLVFSTKPAFTLIEIIIAITVFSIFVAFMMTAYSVFNNAQYDAAKSRSMMYEIQDVLNLLNESVKENKIYYCYYYDCETALPAYDTIDSNELALINADESEYIIIAWNEGVDTLADGYLSMQKFEYDENLALWTEASGYEEPVKLNSDDVIVRLFDSNSGSFRIFPSMDPYAKENINYLKTLVSPIDIFYQPNVKVEMTFVTTGRTRDEIKIDFSTTITSRIYR